MLNSHSVFSCSRYFSYSQLSADINEPLIFRYISSCRYATFLFFTMSDEL
ncbi:hypothetical protein PROVRUST_05364 [Providencia rustigianii DSM 4541]|uniref:Uncharacterized protein n=1 Tax=Providencia rustigianii DSM 4541 TaxID=500637 RepID=D1NZK9_9GAMM|nr:hypothetical protein PROVRUST_05364 [Providencia rustigianii DSM 4541]